MLMQIKACLFEVNFHSSKTKRK